MFEPTCPIWGIDCTVYYYDRGRNIHHIENSFRAGGNYEVFANDCFIIREDMNDSERARLTSFLVEQRMHGTEVPLITKEEIQLAKERNPLPVHERAERLLRFLADQSSSIGEVLEILSLNNSWVQNYDEIRNEFNATQSAMAWSESTTDEELSFLTNYLARQGWITKDRQIIDGTGMNRVIHRAIHGLYLCRVEVPGYSRVAEIRKTPDSSQCFVAMWFDCSMNDVYEKGFRTAIAAAGYTPLRIDRKPDLIGKIDDEIIAEIRRSRFVVADFTHGDGGARGGVYYEAGFAHGLDLPVIFTCRKEMIDETHFDTRQFNHILWENPEDLRKQLTDRILAAIGQGPNRNG